MLDISPLDPAHGILRNPPASSSRAAPRLWRYRFALVVAMVLQMLAVAAYAETAVEVAVRNVQVSSNQVIAAMDARGEDVLTMQAMKGVLQLLQGNNEEVAMIQFNNEIAFIRYRALVVRARDCCRELRAAQAQAQADDEERQAADPAYRKEVEERKAFAAKQQADAELVAEERREVAAGFAVTKVNAGEDPFLNFLLQVNDRGKLTGKTIRLFQAIPISWHLPGNGRVAQRLRVPGKRSGRDFYRSRIVMDQGGALLFDPAPQTFPLGTVGFRRIQMGPNTAFETAWDASLDDQIGAYSDAIQTYAKARPEAVFILVLDTEGAVSFHDDPTEMAGVSFTTVYLDKARVLAEPKLYDAKLQPVAIDKAITPIKR